MKKNTHKKRNFKKTRKYKTRNLRQTVKHNKRNFKKTRKYKGGVTMFWNRARKERERQERERQKRQETQERERQEIKEREEAEEKKRKEEEEEEEKKREEKLKLWKLWAETKNITTDKTYSNEEKIRAVNKGIIYYYFKEYLVREPIFEESYTYDIIANVKYKSKHEDVFTYYESTFKTITTPPIKFKKNYYLNFLKDDTKILTIETKLITPIGEVKQMWEKLPKETDEYDSGILTSTTTYEYSISPDYFIMENTSKTKNKPININDYANEILNNSDTEIDNSKLFEYIFEPKIIPEGNVDEKEDVCIIMDGYVVDKYTYTGADGEIEMAIDKCRKYNTPKLIEERRVARYEEDMERQRKAEYDDYN